MDSPYSPLPLLLENTSTSAKISQDKPRLYAMKKKVKMKKLPDFFKKYDYFSLLMLKIYPAKNLFRRSNSDKIATVLIMKFSAFLTLAHNCIAPNSSIDAPQSVRFALPHTNPPSINKHGVTETRRNHKEWNRALSTNSILHISSSL